MKRKLILLFLCFPVLVFSQNHEQFKKEQFTKNGDTLNYRVMFPEGFSEEKEYPLILFLHGAGERGNDNESQLTHGSEMFLKNRNKFEAIVIFPQAPKEDYWARVDVNRETMPLQFDFQNKKTATKSLQLVMGLMDTMSSKDFVDTNRIYVGGLSMGGMGTYEILYKRLNMFAAAFAICGGANPEIAKAYPKDFNIWIFHGKKDDVVQPKYSEAMARAINHHGGNAKLSLYPNDNHNSWDSAFAEPNLLPWLFSQKRTP
ncbi:Phospholipase/Carboxylesterase [Salegentibacter echinorum]|uniref:Phospholipase/Carboxylesterase n=1 Tax=Salegentibacter echinorum TaxID=1073325 RepID=A0A1M5GF31_SALEC|nr:PHB depolymerase family esterase [Salegentibacter echinorum]SHG02306.1 Phospholipase/Carboxylesterase [Salegentibacter echinorum]